VPVDIRRISSDRAYADYIQWVGRTMRRSLRGWNLVGLQAHQIGIPLDIIVLEVRKPREELGLSLERKTFRLRFIVNPQIKAWSGETGIHAEQCGSLAGWEVFRERDMHITITGYTLEGEYFEMDLHEFIALLFQHEFDHRSEKVENRLLIDFMKKKDIKPIRRKTYNQFNVIATKVGSRMGELLKQLAIAAEDDPELNDETLKRLTDAVTLRGRPGSSITDGTWVEEFDEDPNRM
jgi:peptide deformylase